jgi:hypothetical protein
MSSVGTSKILKIVTALEHLNIKEKTKQHFYIFRQNECMKKVKRTFVFCFITKNCFYQKLYKLISSISRFTHLVAHDVNLNRFNKKIKEILHKKKPEYHYYINM